MPNARAPWIAAMTLLLGAATAAAQDIPSPYRFVEPGQEAGVFVGAFAGDRGRFGIAAGNGVLLGLRYGIQLTDPLAFEAVTTYVDATRDVVSPEGGELTILGEAPANVLFVDARFRWSLTGRRTWNRIMPYIVGGGGVGFGISAASDEDLDLDVDDRFDTGTEFELTLGGGVRVHVRERWALRLEGSWIFHQIGIPAGYRAPARGFEGVGDSEWTANGGLSLGLSYLF